MPWPAEKRSSGASSATMTAAVDYAIRNGHGCGGGGERAVYLVGMEGDVLVFFCLNAFPCI